MKLSFAEFFFAAKRTFLYYILSNLLLFLFHKLFKRFTFIESFGLSANRIQRS